MKTKVILGHELTLVDGRRYRASRPMLGDESADSPSAKLPVTIVDLANQQGDPVAHVADLSYDEANRFLNAFNNGKSTFDGRIW